MGKVQVPKAVLDGLEAVRRSGLTNMLDRPVVAELAEEFGFEEAAHWIRTHSPEFARGLFHGFAAREEKK